jgi:hypothetical protein
MEAMSTRELLAWGMLLLTTAAGALAGYMAGGWVGALSAFSAGSGTAAAILGVQVKGTTNGTGRP